MKRKLNDNPQLYRRSIPKTVSLITTTTQNVSSSSPTRNNDNDKSDISSNNDELTKLKSEIS